MADNEELPTIGQAISNWLGVQLPVVPMPQTLKNFDKAVGKILLAAGENVETRIKGNTAKTKTQGKLNVEGMYRTEEEKRKIENRAETTRTALGEIKDNLDQPDAPSEISDDWLNVFARLAEDKSSEELQLLFGKILAGEVRRPGSFSLRTMQTMSTISKSDADKLSKILSFGIDSIIIPFETTENGLPTFTDRLFLEELGVAGNPGQIGAPTLDVTVLPNSTSYLMASHLAIMVTNQMTNSAQFSVPGQSLTSVARELIGIANPPPTDLGFLKNVSRKIYESLRANHESEMDSGLLKVQIVTITFVGGGRFNWTLMFTNERQANP